GGGRGGRRARRARARPAGAGDGGAAVLLRPCRGWHRVLLLRAGLPARPAFGPAVLGVPEHGRGDRRHRGDGRALRRRIAAGPAGGTLLSRRLVDGRAGGLRDGPAAAEAGTGGVGPRPDRSVAAPFRRDD